MKILGLVASFSLIIALTGWYSISVAATASEATPISQAPSSQAPINNRITLDLSSPSKATLYQDDKVIQKINYDKPGTYAIDTTNLPDGNYRLVVQTAGKTAQYVLHQSFMFSKPGNINAKLSLR